MTKFNTEDYKDIIGIIFLALSFIMLGYMLISPYNQMLIHLDEYFTISVLNFPITDLIYVVSHDVHPPFHYLLLKVVSDILTFLGLESDKIFIYKIMSIVPYAIMLILSVTKIKREHGYLTAGLFAFSIAVTSEFLAYYSIMRMYSWGILFVMLAFIYLKDIIDTNDTKAWVLLTIFSVLAAYTHYFAAIPVVCIYISLFVYMFINDKEKLKFWFISTICGIILYSPWILSLITQVTGVSKGFWIPAITLKTFIGFFGYFIAPGNDIYISIFSIAVFIALAINSLILPNDINKTDKFYIFCGIGVFVGTILIGTIASIILKPLLLNRYLLPSVAVLWFTIAFMVSKLNDKRRFMISFALILILLVAGIGTTISSQDYWIDKNMNRNEFFNHLSEDNNTIVINDAVNKMFYMEYANCTNMYVVNKTYELYGYNLSELHDTFDFKEISKEDVPKLIKNNKDKDIYILTKKPDYNKNIKTTTVAKTGSHAILKVK